MLCFLFSLVFNGLKHAPYRLGFAAKNKVWVIAPLFYTLVKLQFTAVKSTKAYLRYPEVVTHSQICPRFRGFPIVFLLLHI